MCHVTTISPHSSTLVGDSWDTIFTDCLREGIQSFRSWWRCARPDCRSLNFTWAVYLILCVHLIYADNMATFLCHFATIAFKYMYMSLTTCLISSIKPRKGSTFDCGILDWSMMTASHNSRTLKRDWTQTKGRLHSFIFSGSPSSSNLRVISEDTRSYLAMVLARAFGSGIIPDELIAVVMKLLPIIITCSYACRCCTELRLSTSCQ